MHIKSDVFSLHSFKSKRIKKDFNFCLFSLHEVYLCNKCISLFVFLFLCIVVE